MERSILPENSLVNGPAEKIKRTVSLSTSADERETTSDNAINVTGHYMKRTGPKFSISGSGSNKFPTVKQIQCPLNDIVQIEGVIYVKAPSPPSEAHVMTAMTLPGQHPG